MNIEYKNDTYSESYRESFTLTIKAPTNETLPIETTWTPPDQNKYIPEPVEPFVVVKDLGLEKGPYNPRQPVPYISDLSIDGVLVIGWDRTMSIRDDFEKINPARVAINNPNDIALAEKESDDQSRRDRRQLIYRHEGLYRNQTTLND